MNGVIGMAKHRLNHSRYLDYYARDIGDGAVHRAKSTPTAKQVKFYKKLYALCKENGIDPRTGEYTVTRSDYAMAIDKLIIRLQENGVDVRGNGLKASYILEIGEDRRGRDWATERIELTDEPTSLKKLR
jgi:hypothetical protein